MPALALMILIAASANVATAQTCRSCPVGGYAITACPCVSDSVIRDQIASRLAGSVSSSEYRIGVCVQNGVVTLTGVVDTRGRWDLASLFAWSVTGVVQVNNRLTLDQGNLEDMALIGRVRAALGRQPIDSSQVRVRVKDSVVQLTGTVRTEYDAYNLSAAARGVPGVSAVYNNMAVLDFRDGNNW